MALIRVASGWSPSGRALYGNRFLAAFDRNWPREVELQVYVEEPHPMPRNACRSLWDIPGAREFQKKYRTEIIAERIQFGPRSSGAPYEGKSSAPAKESSKKDDSVDAIEYPDEEINPEDIPF